MIAPTFIAITDTTRTATSELLERARTLCSASRPRSVLIQLRDRDFSVRARLRLGEGLQRVVREFDQSLCVNDRLDLAIVLQADAVHLTERSVRAVDIRQRLGDRFWLSRAAHDPGATQLEGADAVILSPVCAARKGVPALGVAGFAKACATGSTRLYALGGIDTDNAASCLAAGGAGVAAIAAWLQSKSIEPLLRALGILREA